MTVVNNIVSGITGGAGGPGGTAGGTGGAGGTARAIRLTGDGPFDVRSNTISAIAGGAGGTGTGGGANGNAQVGFGFGGGVHLDPAVRFGRGEEVNTIDGGPVIICHAVEDPLTIRDVEIPAAAPASCNASTCVVVSARCDLTLEDVVVSGARGRAGFSERRGTNGSPGPALRVLDLQGASFELRGVRVANTRAGAPTVAAEPRGGQSAGVRIDGAVDGDAFEVRDSIISRVDEGLVTNNAGTLTASYALFADVGRVDRSFNASVIVLENTEEADAGFVDRDMGDDRLAAGSAAIDAGDPNAACDLEPVNEEACRVDLGYYGNTANAGAAAP